MMISRYFLPLVLLATPALAQEAQPTIQAQPIGEVPEEEGLTGSVTDDSEWQNLGVAIPYFPTDADVPTQTTAGSTAAMGRGLASIVAANLRNNGLFKPSGPDGLPQPLFSEVPAPNYVLWQGRSAERLVQGSVHANGDGWLVVRCYLSDVPLQHQLHGNS